MQWAGRVWICKSLPCCNGFFQVGLQTRLSVNTARPSSASAQGILVTSFLLLGSNGCSWNRSTSLPRAFCFTNELLICLMNLEWGCWQGNPERGRTVGRPFLCVSLTLPRGFYALSSPCRGDGVIHFFFPVGIIWTLYLVAGLPPAHKFTGSP